MFNDLSSPAALLATRRSGKARDMAAPGPDAAALARILHTATRVPDHGKLAPWRFLVVDDRDALATMLVDTYRAEKPEAKRLEVEAMDAFARYAPTLVIAISAPAHASHIPIWEQELSVGAACMNLLTAAHAEGFVGSWLTGWATYSPGVRAALLPANVGPDGRIAGFIYLGTATAALEERPRPDPATVIGRWPPAAVG